MDQLQQRLAQIALEVIGGRGFVLGGGHAIELHGMASRPSEDIDLFSPVRGSPGEAAADLAAAYEGHGFAVAILRETPDLVQMEVTGAQGQACKVDLGVFWRSRSPVLLEVGPVLHPDDAAGGKMDALFNRWAPRDFLDVDAILSSGRYTRQQLLAIAAEHNPGFSQEMFAEPLSYLRDIPTGNSPPTARIVSRSPGCARTSRTGSTNLKAPPDQQGTQARRAPPTLATSLAA